MITPVLLPIVANSVDTNIRGAVLRNDEKYIYLLDIFNGIRIYDLRYEAALTNKITLTVAHLDTYKEGSSNEMRRLVLSPR
jgi:hypothetical protein